MTMTKTMMTTMTRTRISKDTEGLLTIAVVAEVGKKLLRNPVTAADMTNW